MDSTVIEAAATALWPVVSTGAGERLGAAGTEQALKVLDGIRRSRRERGLPEDPASEAELASELGRLPAAQHQAVEMVVTHFHEKVVFKERVNIGFPSDR